MPYDYDSNYYAPAFDNSYAYGSSEGEYSTHNTANSHYSASGASIGEYAGTHGGTADDCYNYDASGAGPSGLANGMADNAGPGVSTFTGVPLLHPPLYGAGTSAFQNDNSDYGQTDLTFNPFHYASSPEDSSSSSSTSGDSSIANWLIDDVGQQFGSSSDAQRQQSFRPLFHDSYLQARPSRLDASTQSTSSCYFSAGLSTTASTMPFSVSASETSHEPTNPAHANAHSNNSIPLGIDSFAASSISLSVLPLPGTSDKPPQDMSLDSCRDLHMIVNRNIIQETQQVQRLVSEVKPDVHTCTLLGGPNTGAARAPTAINTAPSGLGIPATTTSALQRKRRRAGPQIRERPFKAKPVSPETKYRCHFCGHPSRLLKDHERHEWRHKRTAKDGWFCPGLTSPWAESCISGVRALGAPATRLPSRWAGLQEREGAAKYLTAIRLKKVVFDIHTLHPDTRFPVEQIPAYL
ncbi:hypothetical protein ACEPAH_7839 [Sanghuangporus vaninii]